MTQATEHDTRNLIALILRRMGAFPEDAVLRGVSTIMTERGEDWDETFIRVLALGLRTGVLPEDASLCL